MSDIKPPVGEEPDRLIAVKMTKAMENLWADEYERLPQ